MDLEMIKARREAIVAASPCEGCGATLESCKSQRGKDPTAPSWFGCCARGALIDVPCRHPVSGRALLALIKEIETGTVTSLEDELLISINEHRRGRSLLRYLPADWLDDAPTLTDRKIN